MQSVVELKSLFSYANTWWCRSPTDLLPATSRCLPSSQRNTEKKTKLI